MPFIPVPSAAMVELLYTLDGQKVENTLYFRQAEAWDATELAALCAQVAAWWSANIAPIQTTETLLRAIKATSLESDTAPAIELPVGDSGGVSAETVASNVTLSVKFLTAGRGRSSRGRNYFIGLPQTAVAQNEVSLVTVGQILDAYNTLLDPEVITEGAWSVVSRFEDNAPRDPGIAQLVTAVAVTDNIVDSQRRRLPGRGT